MTQGAAKTDGFMLGTATIMVGPVDQLFNLGAQHSVGLVKNVTVKTTPSFVELTQGIKNTLVASVMNGNAATVTAEMYEYTRENVAYALSLDGSTFEPATGSTTVATAYVAPVDPAVVGANALVLTAVTGITANKTVLIQVANLDNVMIRKVVSVDAISKTITMDSGLPIGVPVGAKVSVANVIPVGANESAPYLGCKIVGTLSNGDVVPMLFGKVRVKSGLSMAFKTDNFDNIPFELDIFDLVETDPFYDYFTEVGGKGMILMD